jgi:hypothetical protein
MSIVSAPPPAKSFRRAVTLNLLLPGAGFLYAGHRAEGAAHLVAFLLCFLAVLGVFLAGYVAYFRAALGADLMREGELERMENLFHVEWLLGFAAAGLLIHAASMARMFLLRRSLPVPAASLPSPSIP